MKIFDVHAHAFPDKLAKKAVGGLAERTGPYQPFTGGTLKELLASMDKAGISAAFLLNIATKPRQAAAIQAWSAEIASDRIVPIGSIHPDSPSWREELAAFKAAGMPGIKFHPMHQGFAVDEPRVFPIYEAARAAGMFIIFHAGNDIVFPGNRQSSVDKFPVIARNFPGLKFVMAHLGGWCAWEEVPEHICGKDIFIDTSFIHQVPAPLRDRILTSHDRNRFLFGTDSPWADQKAQVDLIAGLKTISDDFKEGIFSRNVKLLF